MAKPLLTDELWKRVEPLLPPESSKVMGGLPRVPDRQALLGILFVSRTGCAWKMLARELGCGSGMTCWRRYRDWHLAGVWKKIWHMLLDELGLAGRIKLPPILSHEHGSLTTTRTRHLHHQYRFAIHDFCPGIAVGEQIGADFVCVP